MAGKTQKQKIANWGQLLLLESSLLPE